MKVVKLGFVIGILVTSSAALAEWQLVYKDKDTQFLVETEKIKRTSNVSKAWFLEDLLKEPRKHEGNLYRSTKSIRAFDCTNEQSKIEHIVGYSGQMGKGNVVGSGSSPQPWEPVVPGSVTEVLFEAVCKS